MAGPLEQFEIHSKVPIEVAGYDISITNSAISLAIALVILMVFMVGGMRKAALVSPAITIIVIVIAHSSCAGSVSHVLS